MQKIFRLFGLILVSCVLGCGVDNPGGTSPGAGAVATQSVVSSASGGGSPAPGPIPDTSSPAQSIDTPPVSVPVLRPAEALGLKIVRAAGDSESPQLPPVTRNGSEVGLNRATIADDQIHFLTKIFLRDINSPRPENHKHLFFVWPENTLVREIREVYFTHQIEGQPRLDSLSVRRHAGYDLESRLWFIPIQEIFQDRAGHSTAQEVNSEDWQILTLEFVMDQGPNIIIPIRFQAVGPLPNMHHAGVSQAGIPFFTPDQLSREVIQEGWVVHREEIRSDSPRPFHLWVRGKSDPGAMNMTVYSRRRDSLSNQFIHLMTIGELCLNRVVARRPDNSVEIRELTSGEWRFLVLRPFDAVMLEWWLKPCQNEAIFDLPLVPVSVIRNRVREAIADRVKEIFAPVKSQRSGPFVGFNSIAQIEMEQETLRRIEAAVEGSEGPMIEAQYTTWRKIGVQARGAWSRAIRVTHPFTSLADATLDLTQSENRSSGCDFLTVLEEINSIQLNLGGLPSGAMLNQRGGFLR